MSERCNEAAGIVIPFNCKVRLENPGTLHKNAHQVKRF